MTLKIQGLAYQKLIDILQIALCSEANQVTFPNPA